MEFFQNALAGGMAGVTVDAVLFPLDTIKTRLQARKQGAVAAPVASKSFYRGLLSAMMGSFPSAATFWTAYEGTKSALSRRLEDKSMLPLVHAVAAASADVAVCAVRNPFEVVKQQMQAGLHTTTRDAIKTIMRVDGWRGFYAGYGSTIAREIPFDAIEFTLYEKMKSEWKAAKAEKAGNSAASVDLVLWENGVLGSIAGGTAAALTTPLDVIKTRLMTQTRTQAADRYKGWLDAFTRIKAEEGTKALFSGIKPRVMWISIGGAIFIGSFEEVRRQLVGPAKEAEAASAGR